MQKHRKSQFHAFALKLNRHTAVLAVQISGRSFIDIKNVTFPIKNAYNCGNNNQAA
jgi:hypothetical protein